MHGQQQPSIRQLRVCEIIRKELSGILIRSDMRAPELSGMAISIAEVRISPDLRHATVYVVPLGGRHCAAVAAALNRERKWLRGQLSRHVRLRSVPSLTFAPDTRFDDDARITALLGPAGKKEPVAS